MSEYQFYIHHIITLKLILKHHMIDDVTHVIVDLYHQLVFNHIKYIKSIHPQLIKYFINKQSHKLQLSIPRRLI
jgi:hypothetical protein